MRTWSALLISVLTGFFCNAIAQEVTKPLTIVAPTAPGGLNDIIGSTPERVLGTDH